MRTYPLAIGEILDYGRKWGKWLGTDVITTSTWMVDAGLPVVSQSHDDTDTALFVNGTGLTVGAKYKCKNVITTVGNRTASRVFAIQIVAEKYE